MCNRNNIVSHKLQIKYLSKITREFGKYFELPEERRLPKCIGAALIGLVGILDQ